MEENNDKENKKNVVDIKSFIANNKGQLRDELYVAIAEERLKEAIRAYRVSFVEAVAVDCLQNMFTTFKIAGIPQPEDTSDLKEVLFLVEAMKSLMLKREDIYHPFQELARDVLNIPDNVDEIVTEEEETPK